MRISDEPPLSPWPAESTHSLSRMTEIIKDIHPKPGLPRQILHKGKWVMVWVLMGIGLKLTTPFVAQMGL